MDREPDSGPVVSPGVPGRRASPLGPALARVAAGNAPRPSDRARLSGALDDWPAAAGLDARLDLLRDGLPAARTAFARFAGAATPLSLPTLWRLDLPLSLDLAAARRAAGRPIVLGVTGPQGTGKTTLCAVLAALLDVRGLRAACLSLDDFYLPRDDRRALAAWDPALAVRGPPGTHDVALALTVLDDLRAGRPAAVPRFDKALFRGDGDRAGLEPVAPVDVVLFEGWMVGCRPVPPSAIDANPWPLRTAADRAFARACNARLAAYLPLWERLDRLLVLSPPDVRLAVDWRREAERRMRAAGRGGMSDARVEAFVRRFFRALPPDLFLAPLPREPGARVVRLDARRAVASTAASSYPGPDGPAPPP